MQYLAKNEPHYAARYFLNRLVGPELANQIKLKIYVRKMKRDYGRCWAYRNSPLEYSIILSTGMSRKESLRVLAHECVHVMQHSTGKIKDLWGRKNRNKTMWKNKIMEVRNEEYFKQPWEIEAYNRQENLLRGYLKHIKIY